MGRSIKLVLVMMIIGALIACSTSRDTKSSGGSEEQVSSKASERIRLRDDFDGALSVQSQLAVGTLLLEDTELAVDETQAADLLPLWRAAQSLMSSDTAAALEIEAVYNQIQDTMTSEQISTIAEMELTEEALATMLEEGELFFDRGGFAGGRGEGDDDQFTPPEGGFPGRPGGGIPGGGPGEGPGGGFPEGMNPEAMATRQARFAEDGGGSFQDRALTMLVIRTLERKIGEVSEEDRPIRALEVIIGVIAEETDLSQEEIRAQTAEGVPLTEIIENNGGDLQEAHNSWVDALRELPNAADMDLEQLASELCGGQCHAP